MDGDTLLRVVFLGLILLSVLGWAMVEYRQRLGLALRSALAWGMIVLGLVLVSTLWDDIRGTLLSRNMMRVSESSVELRRARDGHFYADLTINGESVPFMIDTGASSMVLSRRAAERLGIAPPEHAYFGRANTANGTVRIANVRLEKVEFGPFTDFNLPASVNGGEMEGSLLGMDYLSRYSIRIEGERMILSR